MSRLDAIPLELLDLVFDFVGKPTQTVAGRLKGDAMFTAQLADRKIKCEPLVHQYPENEVDYYEDFDYYDGDEVEYE